MKKDLRQVVQRLTREGLVIGKEHGTKHTVLLLRGGVRYACAVSPSDYRGLRNMECEIKRLTRDVAPGHNASTQSACKQ